MGVLLDHSYGWLLPLLHPDLPTAGADLVRGLAEWAFEYKNATGTGKTANHIHDINPQRRNCPFGRARLEVELRGFAPTAKHGRLDQALSDARQHGLVRSFYGSRGGVADLVPTNALVDILSAYVALETAKRDVVAHLAANGVPATVEIDGVAHGAAYVQEGKVRTYERTIETHRPSTPEDGAEVLLRKVRLEHVARLGTTLHPTWWPDGVTAATLLRDAASNATDVAVAATTPPPVRYKGSRVIVTPALAGLVPPLLTLPTRVWVDQSSGEPSSTASDENVVPLSAARAPRKAHPTMRSAARSSTEDIAAKAARRAAERAGARQDGAA